MKKKVLLLVTLGLLILTIIAYGAVIYLQSSKLEAGNYRLNVLSARVAMFLPGYAVCMWLTLLVPDSYPIFTVLIDLVEGYSFYSFFSMVLYNVGGPEECLRLVVQSEKQYFFLSCFLPQKDRVKLFNQTSWLMFHMMFTRVMLSCVKAVLYYEADTPAARVFETLFHIINLLIVVSALLHLVNLCKSYLFPFFSADVIVRF
jgi:hypothetical protein